MKKVPLIDVPPPDMTHADEEKRPVGAEEIVQEDESPLLNCPPTESDNDTVVPGGSDEVGEKVITGVPSIVKLALAESPKFPVTTIVVFELAAIETPTVKEPVTLPPLTLQLWLATRFTHGDVIWQLESEALKPVPWTAILVPNGPSVGTTTIAGVVEVTVKVAEAITLVVPPVTSIWYVPVAKGVLT